MPEIVMHDELSMSERITNWTQTTVDHLFTKWGTCKYWTDTQNCIGQGKIMLWGKYHRVWESYVGLGKIM